MKEYDRFVRAYLATLLSVDESVDRICEALRQSGRLDNTLILFTSDNGFMLGEHGRVDKRAQDEIHAATPLLDTKHGAILPQRRVAYEGAILLWRRVVKLGL